MRWGYKYKEKEPQTGESRIVARFAFFPTRVKSSTSRQELYLWVWLEDYFEYQIYGWSHEEKCRVWRKIERESGK